MIIIDEAHNLVDAVNGAHSAEVAAQTVQAALEQLAAYWARFSGRLAPGAAFSLPRALSYRTQEPQHTLGGTSAGGPEVAGHCQACSGGRLARQMSPCRVEECTNV